MHKDGSERLVSVALIAAFFLLLVSLLVVSPLQAQSGTRIIFLHHSCGHNLIEEGGVREGFTALGYEFYDHGYNDDGLRNAVGDWLGMNYDIPGDNTDPDGLAELFSQPLNDPPNNAFSHLMSYDVIAFKSCFPTSNIYDDNHLNELKGYYLSMRDRMDQYPDKIFVVVTQPPQVPGASNRDEANRARALADWLGSDEYLGGHPNIFTYDFFAALADPGDNFLRKEYRYDRWDAHPNATANAAIGPEFVAFFDTLIRSYDTGVERPAGDAPAGDAPDDAQAEVVEERPVSPVISGDGAEIDGFENTSEPFFSSSDRPESVIECGADANFAYAGSQSLRLHFDIAAGGWADCGMSWEQHHDWSAGNALAFMVRAGQVTTNGTLFLFSGALDNPTPFEVPFTTGDASVNNWEQIVIPFDAIPLAGWADTSGLQTLDPARMTGYGFNFWGDDTRVEGVIWIDDLRVVSTDREAAAAVAENEPELPGETVEESPPDAPEDGGGSGLCPGALLLPVGVMGVMLTRRTRRMTS